MWPARCISGESTGSGWPPGEAHPQIHYLQVKRILGLLVLSAAVALSQPQSSTWDLTITAPDGVYPSWIFVLSGTYAKVVGRVGSVHGAPFRSDQSAPRGRSNFARRRSVDDRPAVARNCESDRGKPLHAGMRLPVRTRGQRDGTGMKRHRPEWRTGYGRTHFVAVIRHRANGR